jgi:hypothetical protein
MAKGRRNRIGKNINKRERKKNEERKKETNAKGMGEELRISNCRDKDRGNKGRCKESN